MNEYDNLFGLRPTTHLFGLSPLTMDLLGLTPSNAPQPRSMPSRKRRSKSKRARKIVRASRRKNRSS